MEARSMRTKKNYFKILMTALLISAVASFLFSFTLGYYNIPIEKLWNNIFSPELGTPEYVVLFNVRLPRIASAFLIGAALSVSGGAYQNMFKNPLVSPDILGVATGAGFGASLAIYFGMGAFMTQALAFGVGLLTAMLAYFVSRRVRYGQTVSLILAGTMLGALFLAGTTMLKYLADSSDTLPSITFWLMGSLAKVDGQSLMLSSIPMAVGFVMIILLRWRINLLSLGDEEAQSMGINPRRTRFFAIIAATLLSASAVCLGGMIGWVGLMIPHIARGLAGPRFGRMLPVCALLGGVFLLLMDDLARSVSTMEIPLGVLTAVVGAPFFLVLILKNKEARD